MMSAKDRHLNTAIRKAAVMYLEMDRAKLLVKMEYK
jgi:hypothetical protein